MLGAAIRSINRTGLTVSLEHLSFEEVIRDAGVSRSTAYRRWPHKDLFFGDLLRELAKAASPAAVANEETTFPVIASVIAARKSSLTTPDGREALLLELIRQGAGHDFQTLYRSTEWRTYLALQATFLSVPDGDLRHELQASLAASERDFGRRIAASWQVLCELFGYRLRTNAGVTFDVVADLASADLRGHVISAFARPELAERRIVGRPFGGGGDSDWSPAALALASIALAMLERDPTIVWDKERITRVRASLASLRDDKSAGRAAGPKSRAQ